MVGRAMERGEGGGHRAGFGFPLSLPLRATRSHHFSSLPFSPRTPWLPSGPWSPLFRFVFLLCSHLAHPRLLHPHAAAPRWMLISSEPRPFRSFALVGAYSLPFVALLPFSHDLVEIERIERFESSLLVLVEAVLVSFVVFPSSQVPRQRDPSPLSHSTNFFSRPFLFSLSLSLSTSNICRESLSIFPQI